MALDRTSWKLVVGMAACCGVAGATIAWAGSQQLQELSQWYLARAELDLQASQGLSSTAQLSALKADGVQALETALKPILWLAVALVLGCTVGAAIGASWLQSRLTRVASRLQGIAQGQGDLTQRIDARRGDAMGELAFGFNGFAERVQGIMQEITQTADTLAGSAGGLSSTVDALNGSAKDLKTQAGSINNTSGSMADGAARAASAMDSAVQEVAQVAAASNRVAHSATNATNSSEAVVVTMQEVRESLALLNSSMEEVAQRSAMAKDASQENQGAVQHTRSAMNKLDAGAEQIAGIVQFIESIAAQTDLLALNATIEAAGAGDKGRGFSVVAQEIKNLARQTAGATERITNLALTMRTETNEGTESLKNLDRSTDIMVALTSQIADAVLEHGMVASRVVTGIDHGTESANAVANSVRVLSDQVTAIAEGSSAVSANIDVVAKSVSALSKQTQLVADGTTATRSEAEDVAGHACAVDSTVNQLEGAAARLQLLVQPFRVA